jgi:DNA-binding CsgD family transcriptional regulator/transcriptional regulator with XRE-family HTH domain/tetratricopeptide (TPR) repeat protein
MYALDAPRRSRKGVAGEAAVWGNLVREHRHRLGLSQEQLAVAAGISVRGLRKIERHHTTRVRPATVRLVASALGLTGTERDSFCAAAWDEETTGWQTARDGGGVRPPEPESGEMPVSERGQRIRLGSAPMVGRDSEYALLRGAVEATARRKGGTVFIVGEPGIGKSRLAAEIGAFAEHRGLTVLRGRAGQPPGQFRPLTEALLSVLRWSGPPEVAGLRPYRSALARLVPEWTGDDTAEEPSMVVLAEAVFRLVAFVGRERGCVLMLEDLHDADPDTLAVLDYLIDNAAAAPLLIIATTRSGSAPAASLCDAAQRRRAAAVLALHRLDAAAVQELAAGCLNVARDGVPAAAVEQLLESADGVPLYVEELLAEMAATGALTWEDGRWTGSREVGCRIPPGLTATLLGRVDRLSAGTVSLLTSAALFGRRFPATAAGAAAGIDGLRLVDCLREAVSSRLAEPEDDPQWYAFRQVLTAEALRARLLPLERSLYARRAAEALEEGQAGRFAEMDQLAGELWCVAGEPARGAQRLLVAGRTAAAQGAVLTAIVVLERALGVATGDVAADVATGLIKAYATAGRIGDAYALGARARDGSRPGQRTGLHLQLARVAVAAGDWARGREELARARTHAGAQPDPTTAAGMDAAEAQLIFGDPMSPQRLGGARQMAERALRGALATAQHEVTCSALNTLGRVARLHDLAEADDFYEQALAVAEEHGLLAWRLTLLYHLGADLAIREAEEDRLVQALALANEAGAVLTAFDIEQELSIVRLCRGRFDAAEESARRCEEQAQRLRLTHTRLLALGTRVMIAGHRARRSEMTALAARFAELGEEDDFSSAVHGLGIAFCHLLHEEREQALAELAWAHDSEVRRPASYLSFIPGPHLFLRVLAGQAGAAECAEFARSAQAQARWNRQFLALAEAVLLGRDGQRTEAADAALRFAGLAEPFPLALHLGLRLVAPDALADGWGEPIPWLRAAEAHFHHSAAAVAGACRALLRATGSPAPQHRRGSDAIPPGLRRCGVTVREFEVCRLVAQGLSDPQISHRLYLSPRTVEKHVAHLLAKTGTGTRHGLVSFVEESG